MTLKLTPINDFADREKVTHFADEDFEVDGIFYEIPRGEGTQTRRLMFETFDDLEGCRLHSRRFSCPPIDEETWLRTGKIRVVES